MKTLLTLTLILLGFAVTAQQKAQVTDGEIVRTGRIPSNFTRPNGQTILGYDNQPDSVLYNDGWRDVVYPEYDATTQQITNKHYDIASDVVTWDVIDKVLPTIDELKAQKIQELRQAVRALYDDIQWYLQMLQANDETISTALKTRLTQIRQAYKAKVTEINALTTQLEVLQYEIPYDQIQTIQEQIESLME